MSENRRRGLPPIPKDYQRLLSEEQQAALINFETFGLRLAFIRQPGTRVQEVVLLHPDGEKLVALGTDGNLYEESSLRTRDDRKNKPIDIESLIKVGQEPIPTPKENTTGDGKSPNKFLV